MYNFRRTKHRNTKLFQASIITQHKDPVETIRANSYNLVAGTKLSFKQFYSKFKREFKSVAALSDVTANTADHKSNRFKVIKAYTEVNKLLANSNLALKSKSYYSSFEVIEGTRKQAKLSNRLNHALARLSVHVN